MVELLFINEWEVIILSSYANFTGEKFVCDYGFELNEQGLVTNHVGSKARGFIFRQIKGYQTSRHVW